MSYGDDEVRGEVVTAFARLGPAHGEKMMVLPCPEVSEDEAMARLGFPSRTTASARERGQLVVSSMREVIRPDTEFAAARRVGRLLTAMERAHPRALLERLGSPRSLRAPDGALCFIGEADAANRTAFGRSLEIALAQTPPSRRLGVDLTRLHSLSVGCAVSLLTLVRGAAGHDLVEVRCDRGQHRTLRRLGAGTVWRLTLTEVVRPW
ncbi:hypothetical protein [Streptomyces decoyicus]|uniref:hypothetical protein n=1 Tax=Streptomyces decoyicus TaxID=249567 RepID=UPI0033B0CBA5